MVFAIFQTNLERRPDLAKSRLQNCITPRGVALIRGLYSIVWSAYSGLDLEEKGSVEPDSCSSAAQSRWPQWRTYS